jgi:hypothetical protein
LFKSPNRDARMNKVAQGWDTPAAQPVSRQHIARYREQNAPISPFSQAGAQQPRI